MAMTIEEAINIGERVLRIIISQRTPLPIL